MYMHGKYFGRETDLSFVLSNGIPFIDIPTSLYSIDVDYSLINFQVQH